ncbi:leukocyte immunoglobulin-like receptor subfamily B member 3 [Elephas maximus indicus]|uniref:leukocyte immunoglobulin-like receptor subfamily B member 3 n=1 Tax=Elephas maximus indicus TaxID=99487 RepID=UPI00211635E2|nr:leukocyte immunoglobulin-like receptor subfamily B member 3 [Elephas maximus indicus]
MGSSVTIWCQGSPQADTYWLYKEGVTQYWDKWAPWNYVDTVSFRIEFMDTGHARQFQCAYQSSSGWSGWSGPLLLVMTAHPSPLVVSGGSVSVSCSSKDRTDTFYLLKEGKNAGPFQANFTMSPMTSTHGGTYRCYSSHSTSPYLLSQPSEPLELVVSEAAVAFIYDLTHAQGLPQYLKVLIGVLVAFVLLLVLFLLLFLLIRHHRQGKGSNSCPATEDKDENLCEGEKRCHHGGRRGESPRMSVGNGDREDAAVRDKQPEKEMELDSQVTHHSRPRQGVATFPSSLFGELQDMKDRQVEEDSQRDSQVGPFSPFPQATLNGSPSTTTLYLHLALPLLQAAAPEDPQDVTYVELNHPTQRRETTAPCSSQSGELSNDPILYAAVAIHYPRTRPRPQSPSRGPVKTQKATELPP